MRDAAVPAWPHEPAVQFVRLRLGSVVRANRFQSPALFGVIAFAPLSDR